ncbi:MAG: PAS domain-containing protein [Gemmatimonas sp.]
MPDSEEPPRQPQRKKRPSPVSSAQALRERANELARAASVEARPDLSELTPKAAQTLIHDLRVHQIELELQNEEMRRTQDALELARTRYFDLFDLAPVSYFTVSEAGVILEVNLTAARLLDVPRIALVKQPLSLFILREDQDVYYRACRQLAKTGKPQSFELRMAKGDGRPFWAWVEATTAHDDDGSPVWRMVMTDITFRKETEQALRAADRLREGWTFYRQIAESLPQLVWTSTADGAWDYVGPQWVAYTGFPAEEQLGLGWLRQVHPDDRALTVANWNKVVAAGTKFDAEFRIRRYDGVYGRFKSSAVPLRTASGEINKWFGANSPMEDLGHLTP